MVERTLFGPGGATESKQDDIIAALALLEQVTVDFAAGSEVALDPATLAALETINATVSGTVALDGPTLAALESVTATIANLPSDYPDSAVAAALADILAATQSDGLTDAELRASPVPVTDQHPDPQTDGLTDAELRASPVPVSGTVVTGALTDAELRASQVNVADSGEREYTHVTATVTASGDTTIHTPASGKQIRLHWVYAINDPSSGTPPLIKVKVGATELYRVWALSKRQVSTGAVDASLVVNLSGAANVAFTAILEEV